MAVRFWFFLSIRRETSKGGFQTFFIRTILDAYYLRTEESEEGSLDRPTANCGICGVKYGKKACQKLDGDAPSSCPTLHRDDLIERGLAHYEDPAIRKFARQSAIQEASCYAGRGEEGPYIMHPTKTRLQETIEFAKRMGYKKLGLAFCAGLQQEAQVMTKILMTQGFEVVSVICKVGRVPKEHIGVKDLEKVRRGTRESMCNPATQAEVLNDAGTEFNILLGLCVGHDSLFLKYANAMSTVFAVKDRVLGHNPMAALYTANQYSQRYLLKPIEPDDPGEL